MRRPSVSSVLVLALVTATAALASADLALINDSQREIYEVYVSPTSRTVWGGDQLAGEVLEPGEALALTGLECDAYDIKLVQDGGEACILQAVEICGDDGAWRLTDDDFESCGSRR